MRVATVVLKKENIQDFAKERNELLAKAKSDWVFFVDSDEKVSHKLKKEIDSLFHCSIVDTYQGLYIKRNNYFLGDYVGTDKILRLAKKNAGKWVREVHETWQIDGKVGELANPLLHNTADNLSDYIRKINIYSELHALANRKERKNSSIFKAVFYPPAKFLVTYYHSRHLVFSLMQAFHSYLAWSKEWINQNQK